MSLLVTAPPPKPIYQPQVATTHVRQNQLPSPVELGLAGSFERSTLANMLETYLHPNFPTPLRATLEQLARLRTLADGWNGYNAVAPNLNAINHAASWIHNMHKDALKESGEWLEPHVIADEQGNVVFEWWNDSKKMTIYVGPETIEYLKVWGPDIMEDMEDGDVQSEVVRRALWAWLMD